MVLESLSSLATYYDIQGYWYSSVFLDELPSQVKLEGCDSQALHPINHVDEVIRNREAV